MSATKAKRKPRPVPRRESTLPRREPWRLPRIDLPCGAQERVDTDGLARRLVRCLREQGAPCKVARVIVGPSVLRFELVPDDAVPMRYFTRLGRAQDIAYALSSAPVTIAAPIPGRSAVGIEVPLPEESRRLVTLGDVAEVAQAPLMASMGLTVDEEPLYYDLASGPHTLCVAQSGGGKSSLVRGMLASLLLKASPDELGILAIDPKIVELSAFNGIPHMYSDVVTDARTAVDALSWVLAECEARYKLISRHGYRDLDEYNARSPEGHVPTMLVVCDEFADLILQAKEQVEGLVARIAAKGRAAGIHLLLCTQTCKREIVTGVLRANLPARIALRTASAVDSRLVLERAGAEALLGRGDAILSDGRGTSTRFQAAHIDSETLTTIVRHWKGENVFRETRQNEGGS